MKTIQFKLRFLIILAIGFTLTSCVEDDDFETPDVTVSEPEIDGEVVTINSIAGIITQNEGETTVIEENIYVEGYVVSSDEAGNFFEEIIIQDKPENPTRGIRISVNVNPLFSRYNFGRKVFVKMQGLAVGISNGVGVIGTLATDGLGQIQENQLTEVVLRSPEVATIVPHEKNISELQGNDLLTYVRLKDVQFSGSSLGKTFAAEPSDDFDGERLVEGCQDGETLIFSTSSFADFKTTTVPEGSGSIDGIYSLNFFGDTPIFAINGPNDFNFDDTRCNIQGPLEPNITIAEVKNLYNGSLREFTPNDNLIMEGYVVSSDARGNFFKNLYIQDKPINPTAAIQIVADENDLFQIYSPGRKVLVKLDRLALGEAFGGVVSLGFIDGGEVDRITEGQIGDFVFATDETEDIVPTPAQINPGGITIDELDDNGNPIDDNGDGIPNQIPAPQGILINIDNVQMPLDDVGSAYAFYSGTSSANRSIESCDTGATTILRNSGFADFANTQFPTGQGSITAVLSAFNDTEQLLIRSTNDVNLTGDRCDPLIFECGTLQNPAANSFINENFEGESLNQPVNLPGWTNFIEAGTQTWETYTDNGTNASLGVSARVGSFQSGDASTVAWLISPNIPISSNQTVSLEFQTSNSFSDGSSLQVLFSSDWDGTEAGITNAEWGLLADANVVSDGEFFANWVSSGVVDLSCLEQDGYVAFKYSGSGSSNQDGTYELDEIEINVE